MVYKGQLAAVHGGLDVLHHLRPQADFLCVVVDDIAKGALGFSDLVGALGDVVRLCRVEPLQLLHQVAALVEVHIELHTSFQAGEVECTRADAVAVFIHLFDDVRGVTTSGRVFPRAAAHQIGAGLVLMNKGVQRGLIGLLGTSVAVRRLGLLYPEGLGVAGTLPKNFHCTITVCIGFKSCHCGSSTAFIGINSKFCPSKGCPTRVRLLDLEPGGYILCFAIQNRHNNGLGPVSWVVDVKVLDLVRKLGQLARLAVVPLQYSLELLHLMPDIFRSDSGMRIRLIHVVVGTQGSFSNHSQLRLICGVRKLPVAALPSGGLGHCGGQLHGPFTLVSEPAIPVLICPRLDGVFEILNLIVTWLIFLFPLLPVACGDAAVIPNVVGHQILGHISLVKFVAGHIFSALSRSDGLAVFPRPGVRFVVNVQVVVAAEAGNLIVSDLHIEHAHISGVVVVRVR